MPNFVLRKMIYLILLICRFGLFAAVKLKEKLCAPDDLRFDIILATSSGLQLSCAQEHVLYNLKLHDSENRKTTFVPL